MRYFHTTRNRLSPLFIVILSLFLSAQSLETSHLHSLDNVEFECSHCQDKPGQALVAPEHRNPGVQTGHHVRTLPDRPVAAGSMDISHPSTGPPDIST